MPFDKATLDELRHTEEVRIRTTKHPKRGVITWIMVANGAVFVRSVHGVKGEWYLAAKADGNATLVVNGRAIPVRAMPVTDAATIDAVSQTVLSKYAASPYAKSMVAPDVLGTTLRLETA